MNFLKGKYLPLAMSAIQVFSCSGDTARPVEILYITDSLPPPANPGYAYTWLSDSIKDDDICKRFPVPAGFRRVEMKRNSFGDWLRFLPLYAGTPDVLLYNGKRKFNQSAQAAVINIDVGKNDLQQCADAVMRLRAEYFYSVKQYDSIAFNYTSGDRIPFSRWSRGERPVVNGNKVSWKAGGSTGNVRDNFRKYLDNIFSYAGSLSLEKELKKKSMREIMPGDVFIVGGSPGHAVIVLDVAVNDKKEKLFLLAQSYMPAQQVHVLRNPNNDNLSPWYSVKDCGESVITPEYDFTDGNLRSF